MAAQPICTSGDWPWSLEQRNSTLAAILDNALYAAFSGNLSGNEALIYCAVQPSDVCQGICPNADVTGVGVRVAFYLNAILTTLLVGLSPRDSPSAAWSSTILTMSLVIPAIIQKKQAALTLYHATLVLNFATFSSVSSLAVVPLCTIWRHIDNTDHPLFNATLPAVQQLDSPEEADAWSVNATTKPQRRRARIVLSFALIAQVSFQWGWAAYLFVSPYYAQTACNPFTMVVLFGVSKTALEINRGLFGLWASWLLFSILVTLLFGILLVNSCTSGVNAKVQSRKQLRQPKRFYLRERVRAWDKSGDKRRRIIFATAFVICLLLVAFSETQVKQNCVFNENTQWGFGQLAALLFALAPLWNILESEKGQHLGKMLFALLSRKDAGQIEDRTGNDAATSRGHNFPTSPPSGSLQKSDADLQDILNDIPTLDITPSTISIHTAPRLGSESVSCYTMVDEVPTISIVPPSPYASSLNLSHSQL